MGAEQKYTIPGRQRWEWLNTSALECQFKSLLLEWKRCMAQSRHWVFVEWENECVREWANPGSARYSRVASRSLHSLFSVCKTIFPQVSSWGFCSNVFVLSGLSRKTRWNGTLALPLPFYLALRFLTIHNTVHLALLQLKFKFQRAGTLSALFASVSPPRIMSAWMNLEDSWHDSSSSFVK